ncbi:PAS domain-containing sensor histidine kinase [Solimonas fluminis]|uniref:histidine kinase n=1 Tax=Solimonas fluminis TaxID=2086571 RepID=A0A2S5TH62_9GAMM|nr:PAS domain-containing sensor histidine kinase [Solimonas fluminis]PPE74305.1 PAS domain-containing sensor histidine kinase [Solimonas fluminis]
MGPGDSPGGPQGEALFRLAVEAAPNAMVMVGSDGRIALVNAQTEKLFGYPRSELIGQRIEMLVPQRNRGQHPQQREDYLRDPQTRSMGTGRDLYGLTRDGREVPIEIGLNPLKTGNGTLVLASIIDITERKRIEDAVRRSEARFRLMVSSVKDYAILMLDPQGLVASWNDGAQRLKGYAEPEILGRHFSTFYPPEEIASGRPDRELRRARDEGRFEDEGWRLRRDGSRFWASVIITPMFDEAGALTGYSKVTRDITERKRSEERFRLVVEAAPNAMIMVDAGGRISLVNAQTEKLFGYPREDLIGMPVEMLVPQGRRLGHPTLRESYFGKPQTRAMGSGRDLHGQMRDGRQVPIEIGLNPIETSEGLFVLASIIDITERKRAEQELRNLNQSLAAQIDETSAALAKLQVAQSQLVQAEKLASLGGLVAGISHEINTPVGIGVTAASHLDAEVRNLTRAVAAGGLTKSQFDRFLQSVSQSSDIILMNLRRAAELIQSFKRVAVDQSSEERRRIRLKAYFEEVLVSLRPKMKTTPHRIELDCPEELEMDTIPGAWSQVLTNLVVNALSHAFDPGQAGLMRIEVDCTETGVRVRFRDDGHGIAAENLAKIFDPFFTTRRGQGGTGLGLHIVFNLVHQTLGGSIGVDSAPGHGTCFTILLPQTRRQGAEP